MPSRGESSSRLRGAILLLGGILVSASWGCDSAQVSQQSAGPATERPPGGGGSGGSPSRDGGVMLPDAPADAPAPGTDGGACQPVSCTPPGGKYCGNVGNGCGKTIDCGMDCPPGQSCGGGGVKNLCGAPPAPGCTPITCMQAGGRLCGRVGDGCGGALDCPACPAGETCGANLANVCGTGTGGAAVCDNLCKQQVACAAGQETTLAGTVLAPTPPQFGKADPLYNALVYVPNAPLAPFPAGVACDLCGTPVSGRPLTTALSGPDGTFLLKNVPAGENIPLVIQIGRWRRQVTIPKVAPCTRTDVPPELTRLPRSQAEGNIPQMAIATGQWDPFECVLRKIGIADSEFTPPSGPGRVHVFQYGGLGLAQPVPPGGQLVTNAAALARYDMVLLPCDDESIKLRTEQALLREYTAKGGRLFLTDYSYSWLKDGGPWEALVNWFAEPYPIGRDFNTFVDRSFPKGQAFADWLTVVGASTMPGRLPVHDPYSGYSYTDGVRAPAQRWLYTMAPPKNTAQHFTFNTPVEAPAEKQCGRVVYSTFHVAEEGEFEEIYPKYCTDTPMTPQEKALEFMLFDASACVQPDTEKPRVFEPPPPPPPPPPPAID